MIQTTTKLRPWLRDLVERWLPRRDPVLQDLERAATEARENLDSVVRFVSASQLERPKSVEFFDEDEDLPDGYLWDDPLPERLSEIRGKWLEQAEPGHGERVPRPGRYPEITIDGFDIDPDSELGRQIVAAIRGTL